MSDARYYLSHTLFGAREVSRSQFIDAERKAGFHPKSGRPDDLATAGFSRGDISGSIRHDRQVEPSAMVRVWRELLIELAESVESEVEARYGHGLKDHPAMAHKYAADIEPARKAREILALPIELTDVRLDLLETAIAQHDTSAARELVAELRTRLSVQDTRVSVLRDALDSIRDAHRFNVAAIAAHEVHAIAFSALELVTAPAEAVVDKQAASAIEPFANALRALASHVGAGADNAGAVDPAEYERKIRQGINQLLEGKKAQTDKTGNGKVCPCQFGNCLGAEVDEDCKAELSKQGS